MSFLRPFLRTTATASPMRTPARTFTSTPANAFARMTISGRLGAAPELQTLSNGREVVKYVVATSSGSRENRHTNWFRVTSFQQPGPAREYMMDLLKGSLVIVEADAQTRVIENPDGRKTSTVNLTQRTFQVLAARRHNQENQGEGNESEVGEAGEASQ